MKVQLYIYDLSKGMAAMMSPLLIGKKIDGVWHTAIVVYGQEYFFGSSGVEHCVPGSTRLGQPQQKVVLGETHIPFAIFAEYLRDLSEESYGPTTYNLLTHNCNNFSDELAYFLCGTGIPKHILDLPNEVLHTGFGTTLLPLIQQLEHSARPTSPAPPCGDVKLANNARVIPNGLADSQDTRSMAESETSVNGESVALPRLEDADDDEETKSEEERKANREPPIIFTDDLDIAVEFDALVGLIDGKLNSDEQNSLEDLHKFILENEGGWVLGENFLVFIGRLLNDEELAIDVRIHTLNVLALAVLKDDIILLLHQDRREHMLMNYAFSIDHHTTGEQLGLATLICNMFENLCSSEWLLYISEWSYKGLQISNIQVTTKVAVHSLLADEPALQDRGVAIIHNLACKEVKTVVFDDVAVELSMALLQYFQKKPSEENLFRTMKAMAKFVQISRQEVPQLIQMIGPDPNTFKGTSARIDELIDDITAKCR